MSAARPLLTALALAALLGGCGEKRERLALPAVPTRVAVALDAPPDVPLAPLYAAISGGDFTRGGLAVSVSTPTGGAIARLSSGAADVAVVSEPDLLRARDQGATLVAIAALVQSPLEAIISVAPHPITKVTQLDGRRIGAPATPLAGAELDTMLRAAGVAPAGVRRRDPGPDLARTLVAKQADAGLGSWHLDAVRLAHHQPSLIKVEDAGVPTYDRLVLVVRQTEAGNRGPILRTFLQALSAGARAATATPATAAGLVAAANPAESPRLALAALKAILPVLGPAAAASPYGFVDPRAWRAFGAWMLAHGLITRPGDAARAATDEFLPGQGESATAG